MYLWLLASSPTLPTVVFEGPSPVPESRSVRLAPDPPSRGGQDERDENGDDHPDDVRVDADRFALLQGKQVYQVAEEPDGQGGVGVEEDVCAEPRHDVRPRPCLSPHVGEIDRHGDEDPHGGDDVEDGPSGPEGTVDSTVFEMWLGKLAA